MENLNDLKLRMLWSKYMFNYEFKHNKHEFTFRLLAVDGTREKDNLLLHGNWSEKNAYKDICESKWVNYRDIKVILKPLYKLMDYDAIMISKIAKNNFIQNSEHIIFGRKICDSNIILNINRDELLEIFQYLQHYGYDIPQYILEGKTLNEVGLAIYE